MKINIAVVQFYITQLSPEINLKRAETFVKKASHLKADVIVFPEDFITGPIFRSGKYVDFNETYKNIFIEWARKYHIDIVSGSIIEGENDKWFNTSYYIDAKGTVKGKYRKIHLWHPERKYFSPGNNIVTFQTKFGKTGLIICWDLIYPELFREMINRGVKIIYCPSYWTVEDAGIGLNYNKNAEHDLVNSLSIARAFENEIIFVYPNASGSHVINGLKGILIGQSQITAPFKGIVKRLEHNREEMFVQEVDLDILNDAEKVYKIRKDLKKSVNNF